MGIEEKINKGKDTAEHFEKRLGSVERCLTRYDDGKETYTWGSIKEHLMEEYEKLMPESKKKHEQRYNQLIKDINDVIETDYNRLVR